MSTITQPTGASALQQPGMLPQQPQMALQQPAMPIQQQPMPMPIQQQQMLPVDTMKPAMAPAPPATAAAPLPVQQPLPGTTTTTTTTTSAAGGWTVPTVEGQHLPVRTNCPYCSGEAQVMAGGRRRHWHRGTLVATVA